MLDAADEARLEAFGGAGELEVIEPFDERAKERLELQTREVCSQAHMLTNAKADMQIGIAVDAKREGSWKTASSRLAEP